MNMQRNVLCVLCYSLGFSAFSMNYAKSNLLEIYPWSFRAQVHYIQQKNNSDSRKSGKSHATVTTTIHVLVRRDAILPLMIDQLDPLVGPVMGHTVIDHNVESVPLAPHVDEEGHRVTHVDGTGYPGP
jgi:hypothetical protein